MCLQHIHHKFQTSFYSASSIQIFMTKIKRIGKKKNIMHLHIHKHKTSNGEAEAAIFSSLFFFCERQETVRDGESSPLPCWNTHIFFFSTLHDPLLSVSLSSCCSRSLTIETSLIPPNQTLGVLCFPLRPPSRKGATQIQKICLASQLTSKDELPL
jgi:hypothetical protein